MSEEQQGHVHEKWFPGYGIQNIESALYCPQSNGIVERVHGTLMPMIQRCIEDKRDWAEMVPHALFFIRMTPV